jgi:hypothetical protein
MRAELICHPDTPPRSVKRVRAGIAPNTMGLSQLEYRVFAGGELALPAPARPGRRDELWKTTCFEMFTRVDDEPGYQEYNFGPSRDWAAYDFTSHRKGRRDLTIAAPAISGWGDVTGYVLDVKMDLMSLWASECRIGLSAVIEEADGTKSYWALAHPPGEPDFHHPDCFALELPPLV